MKIKDMSEVLNGYAFKSSNYINEGYRVIRITNVQSGYIEDEKPVYYEFDNKLEKYELKENDLLISLTGNVGRCALVTKDFLPAYINQRVCCLRINKEKVIPKFLYYILNSKKFEFDCINSSQGIAQLNMSTEWLKEYNLAIPAIELQKKIINIFDKVYNNINIKKNQINSCNNLIKSQFVEMFGTNKKSKYEFDILNNLTLKITDGKHGGCNSEDNSGYYFVGATEIYNDKINYQTAKEIIKNDFEKDYKRCDLKNNDFVIVNTGATIGKSAIVNSNLTDHTLLQKSVALIRTKNDVLNPLYLKYCYEINPDMYNKGNGCARINLLLSQIKKTMIPVPPIELQNEFAKIVEQIDKQKFVCLNMARLLGKMTKIW